MGDFGVEGAALARLVAQLQGTIEHQDERLMLVENQLRRLLEGSGAARLDLGEDIGSSGSRRPSGSAPSSHQASHHSRLEGSRPVAPSYDTTSDMPAAPAALRKNLLTEIYESPYQRARKRGAITGSTLLGVLALPFGPVGMASSAIFGAMVGGAIGHLVDKRNKWMLLNEHEILARRLRSLVRWAWQHQFDEDLVELVEMVTAEFKPVVDVASGSRDLRHLLRQLDAWISQKRITRELWAYMDGLLRNWRNLGREELVRRLQTLQTLQVMYKHTRRQLDEEEVQFLRRMDRILEHDFVQDLLMHAKQRPNENETRAMQSMVFADTLQQQQDSPSRGQSGHSSEDASPAHPGDAHGGACREHVLEPSSPCSRLSVPHHVEDMGTFRRRPSSSFASGDPEAPTQLKLKRPFFTDWKDFLDFDTLFKQKTAITLSEFDLLLEKEEESLQGWDVCVERPEIKVAKIQFGPNLTLRAWATVPGVDMLVAFHLFYSHEMRMRWDKTFATMRIIQEDVHGSSILYSLLKVPTATPRDFLQYRRVQVQEDGSILIVLRSAEHADMPEDKRYIRAESFFSGYVLRQTYDGDRPTLKIFLTSCLDIKGMVPKWLVNYMAPKAPKEWVENLRKAAVEYQERNPSYKEGLARQLDVFKGPNPFDYEPKDREEVSL